jgi:hypothetical protein
MADDDWTFVPRKKQGKATPRSTISHTPLSIKDATLEDIAREYGVKSRIWKRSEARQKLHRTLSHLKPDSGWQIQTAVCLGTGSFTRDNFDCRKRTMEQFAMFTDTIDYLRDTGEDIKDIYVQEGWYNELDKTFLATLDMSVPEMKPGTTLYLTVGRRRSISDRTHSCVNFILSIVRALSGRSRRVKFRCS